MSIEKSESQDLTDQDNEAYLQNYTKLFKKLHKFKTSTDDGSNIFCMSLLNSSGLFFWLEDDVGLNMF
jgi:hypothetical protein